MSNTPNEDDGSEFVSPLFGPTRRPTQTERDALRIAAAATPVAVFQELNKWMNDHGMKLSIEHNAQSRH